MRVAVLIDAWLPFLGGGQKSVLEITRILKSRHKIDFIILHSFSNQLFFRLLWMLYLIPEVIFCHLFIQRFDLIDARAFLAGFPAKIISLILRIPVIYTVNGCGNLDQKKKGFFPLIEKILLTKIEYHQQISDSQHFLKYPNVNKNILVIPNGVNVSEFDTVRIKKNYIFTIIYVGRLAEIKGLIYLLKAIKIIIKKDKNFLLKIVGKGEIGQFLKNYVKENNLEKWVNFTGELKGKKLIEAYKSSHLFVLPSLAEGQPITLLEAWAAKLPVLATKVGACTYLVNNKNGFLVAPKKVMILTETIKTAMNKKGLYKLGISGYQMVKKNFSWQIVAEKYFTVYKKLISLSSK